MGYPSWLICDSDEQYFETARRGNDATLREAFGDINPAESRAKIFNNEQNTSEPFLDMVKYAFRNRDAMISSGGCFPLFWVQG